MSLKSFLKLPEVVAKVKLLRPRLPRKIPARLRAEARSKRYTMVGTAFDYLMRFELQRRAPHAVSECWVAERAPGILWKADKGVVSFMQLCKDDRGVVSIMTGPDPGIGDEELAKEMAERARRVVEKAKSAVAAYLKSKSPTPPEQASLAGHAIRLAKLDELCRARQFNPAFEEANAEDVEDLLALLSIVPFPSLIHPQIMLLNPIFGEASSLVGGADTDLITGDMLADFKTTKASEMSEVDLDQLFGYYLLARRHRQSDRTFPVINRLALYICRHAFLWVQDATTWTNHPLFSETEEWFFKHAKQVFSAT
jgi:hypothetical protein